MQLPLEQAGVLSVGVAASDIAAAAIARVPVANLFTAVVRVTVAVVVQAGAARVTCPTQALIAARIHVGGGGGAAHLVAATAVVLVGRAVDRAAVLRVEQLISVPPHLGGHTPAMQLGATRNWFRSSSKRCCILHSCSHRS